MDIWEADKLFLFIAFVIPGFISIKCYQLMYPGVPQSSSQQIIDAIAYSCLNYAILAVPIALIERSPVASSYPVLYYLFYLFTLFLGPMLWVIIWRRIRICKIIQRSVPHPTARPWDFAFQKRKPYWVKVTLQNGTIIAGRYSEQSFSSSAPAEEQIYLEEKWVLGVDGEFLRKIDRTAGVIILSKDISFLEFRE